MRELSKSGQTYQKALNATFKSCADAWQDVHFLQEERKEDEPVSEMLQLAWDAWDNIVPQSIASLWNHFEALILEDAAEFVTVSQFHGADERLKESFKRHAAGNNNVSAIREAISERFQKAKGRSSFERLEALIRETGREIKFDSSQELDEFVRKGMMEWVLVRNLIVHKAGIADRKFVNYLRELDPRMGTNADLTLCPSDEGILVTEGEKVEVNATSLDKYSSISLAFLGYLKNATHKASVNHSGITP